MPTQFHPGPLSLIWDAKHTIPSKRLPPKTNDTEQDNRKQKKQLAHGNDVCTSAGSRWEAPRFLDYRRQTQSWEKMLEYRVSRSKSEGRKTKRQQKETKGGNKETKEKETSPPSRCQRRPTCLLPFESLHVHRVGDAATRHPCMGLQDGKQIDHVAKTVIFKHVGLTEMVKVLIPLSHVSFKATL